MGPIGSVGAAGAADLTRLLVGAAGQQQVDLAKKMVDVNVAQTVKAQANATVGQVLDVLA